MSKQNARKEVESMMATPLEDSSNVNIGVFKVYNDAKPPEYKTHGAACFDIEAYLGADIDSVTVYTQSNQKISRNIQIFNGVRAVIIEPGERVMVPSGLIFDIPEGFKISLYARSGTALKQGLNLINSVGVVDHDYIDQTFMIVMNNSNVRQTLEHGNRYAQAEISPIIQAGFENLTVAPSQKTNRVGGFGSTNKQ